MLQGIRKLFGGRSAEHVTTELVPGAVSTGPLVRLEGVTKTFVVDRVETRALSSVDLAVERGEFVAVNGPSGSGKSTLLSIVGLLDTPSAGTYHLNGFDVAGLGAKSRAALRNREVGFIFQSFNLIGDLTVRENVELPLTYQGMSATDRRERVDATLARFELAEIAGRYPSALSGGHQQRVGVARAVVGAPRLLLADEPTGNLSSRQAEAVIEMLQELHRGGATILLVSHDPRWRGVAGRAVELFDGSVVAS
ncbi:MAG TPA: ABC transporter ATP-binding protein [Thermoanaerobaculia bacterium]|nr:ABC transporter ATP-binding protein [Thermoanaerobaculia bacterium]